VAENVELLLDRLELNRWSAQHGAMNAPRLHH